jgi:hypothetical protein
MVATGRLTSYAGRKSGGKKIDTWEFFHPDGETVKVSVSMHSGTSGIAFLATALNGPAKEQSWEDSDIEALRDAVAEGLSRAATAASENKWVDSLLLKLHPAKNGSNAFDTGFRLEVDRLQVKEAGPTSNQGEIDVLQHGRLGRVTQRSIGEDRPDDEMCGIRIESQHTASICKGTPEAEEQILRLCRTLDSFALLLGRRLGPDQIDLGIPDGDELVRLMKDATSAK